MRKYRIKKRWLISLLILIILVITVAGNIVLARLRPIITKTIHRNDLTHEISIGKMFFVFPNFIVLRNFTISKSTPSSIDRACVLPTTIVQFSLPDIFKNGNFLITDIILYRLEVNYLRFRNFVHDNFQAILEILRNIPKEDIVIRFKDASVDLGPRGDKAGHIWTDFVLTLQGDAVSGYGLIRRDKYSFSLKRGGESRLLSRGLPLRCLLEGFVTPDGFSVENFSLSREDHHVKFWAGFSDNMLQLKGFALLNTPPEESRRHKSFLRDLLKKFKRSPHRKESTITVAELSQKSLFILNIDCRISIALPWIRVERFEFTVNDAPVSLKGNIFVSNPPSLDITALLRPAHSGRFRAENIDRLNLTLAGSFDEMTFKSDVELNIYFKERSGRDSAHAPERLEIEVKDLAVNLDTYDQLKIHLGKSRTSFWSDENIHTMHLQDLEASLNFRTDAFKYLKIHSPFYDGELNGKIWLDTSQAPFKISSSFVLSDVDANKLDELLVHFSKVEGRLFSNINFTNYPKFDLSGGINVQKGVLTGYDFFNWLADTFELPSLKKINFKRASASFSVDEGKAGLHDIRLESEDMSIKGHFSIATNSLVSSTLSMSFGRDLLAQSRKCRLLLQLFEPDMPAMDFGFKLSGDQHAMNFQWLPSDTKEKIRARIPDFIERGIERNIDRGLR